MKKIHSLKDDILLIQLEIFTNKFDKQMSKDMKKTKKWLKIAFIPYGACIGLSIILLSPIPLVVGSAYLAIITLVKQIKDEKDFVNQLNRKYNISPNVTFIHEEDQEMEYDFLNKPIITKTDKDYYSEEFQSYLNKETTPIITIVGQKNNIEESTIEEEKTIGKIPTMERISDEYRTYSRVYKLPPLKISNKEWELLFDTMYHQFEEYGIEELFYEYASALQRYVFAYALVKNTPSITIYSYLEQLPMLEKISPKNLDLASIQKEIESQLKPTKIIKFPSLRKVK